MPPNEIHLTIDRDTGKITEASPLLAELLGFEPGELTGRHYTALSAETRFAAGSVPWDSFQEFAYVAAHDLRAPLRRVSNLAGMLRTTLGKTLDPAAQPMLEQLIQASAQGAKLVAQLQVFAEALGPPIAGEAADCAAAFRFALQKLRPEVEASKAEIDAGDLPLVHGHSALLQVVFENLLSNAIRFRSAETPLRIAVSAVRHGDFWRMSLSDNGMGIDSSGAGYLFQPFKRLHSSRYSGSGLGLAICRNIVGRSGGDIWLGEHEGPGTTIVVALKAWD